MYDSVPHKVYRTERDGWKSDGGVWKHVKQLLGSFAYDFDIPHDGILQHGMMKEFVFRLTGNILLDFLSSKKHVFGRKFLIGLHGGS